MEKWQDGKNYTMRTSLVVKTIPISHEQLAISNEQLAISN